MGNNHDKFFSKEKRKLLLLGYKGAGKTTLVKTLSQGQHIDEKQDLQIVDIKLKNITLCVFDMGGNDRQRIFWRQNYYGSQGVIFVINCANELVKSLNELEKVVGDTDLNETPIAVFVNKINADDNTLAIKQFVDNLQTKNQKKKVYLFEGSTQNYDQIMKCIEWLGKEMKPI